jgi:hypothetical protein
VLSTEAEIGTQQNMSYYPTMRMVCMICHLNMKLYMYCLSGRQEEGYRRGGKVRCRKSQIKSGKTKNCNPDDDDDDELCLLGRRFA